MNSYADDFDPSLRFRIPPTNLSEVTEKLTKNPQPREYTIIPRYLNDSDDSSCVTPLCPNPMHPLEFYKAKCRMTAGELRHVLGAGVDIRSSIDDLSYWKIEFEHYQNLKDSQAYRDKLIATRPTGEEGGPRPKNLQAIWLDHLIVRPVPVDAVVQADGGNNNTTAEQSGGLRRSDRIRQQNHPREKEEESKFQQKKSKKAEGGITKPQSR